MRDRVVVCVLVHSDASSESVLAHLRTRSDILLVPRERHPEADVVLTLAATVGDNLLADLADIADGASNPHQCMVLVADPLSEQHLFQAVGSGVVSILARRLATPRMIAHAIMVSRHGGAMLPASTVRWIVDNLRLYQQNMLSADLPQPGGLNSREVAVLRLIADGKETAEIAEKLNYSERTIKKVLQDLSSRLGLRNRAHAVSYALRIGAI